MRSNDVNARVTNVQQQYTSDQPLSSIAADRLRVSSPPHLGVGIAQGDEVHFDNPASRPSIAAFQDRVSKERHLTEANNVFFNIRPGILEQPDEYFDYCFVFHSHPADFGQGSILEEGGERQPLLERGPTSRVPSHRNLASQMIRRDEIRHYLARVCCYRDIDSLERGTSPQRDDSEQRRFISSFSMAMHHHPDATRPVLQDTRFSGILREIFNQPESPRILPKIPETAGVEMLSVAPSAAPAQPSEKPPVTNHLTGELSPPLALVKDHLPAASAFHFASAGANTLPGFYGLQDFLDLLEQAGPDFSLSVLDFLLIVRETVLGCLRKAGADIAEFVSRDGSKMLVKVRLREKPSRRVANHLEYLCACRPCSNAAELMKQHSGYVSPYLHFDESAEDIGLGYHAAREGEPVWKRYDGLNREVHLPHGPAVKPKKKDEHPTIDELYPALQDASLFRDVDRIRLLTYVTNVHFNVDVLSNSFDCRVTKCRVISAGPATVNYEEPEFTFLTRGRNTRLPPAVLGCFPLHKKYIQKELRFRWANMKKVRSSAQPIDTIRNYFGEQIGFYFLWTGFLTQNLKGPAFVGVITYLIQMAIAFGGRFKSPVVKWITIAFAIYMSIWGSLFSVRWRKAEKYWRLRWGMESEKRSGLKMERPGFRFDYFILDPLNPRRFTKYYSKKKGVVRTAISALLTVIGIVVIVSCVVSMYYLKAALPRFPTKWQWINEHTAAFISSAQALQIVCLDYAWCKIVKWQTGYENHRYELDFQRSIVSKMMLFRFTNNFYALLYIAFFRNYVEQCAAFEAGGCAYFFQLQLCTLYFCFITLNSMELFWPLFTFWKNKHGLDLSTVHDSVELQYYEDDYGPARLVEDYMEIVIQYCAVVFFSVALPLTPLLAYIQTLIEIRVDAIKLTDIVRRPYPHVAPEGLSMYNDIIAFAGALAAPMNVGLCIFLIPFGESDPPLATKLLYFIMAEHFLLMIKTFISFGGSGSDMETDTIREFVRLATHEIVWGSSNALRFGGLERHESYGRAMSATARMSAGAKMSGQARQSGTHYETLADW